MGAINEDLIENLTCNIKDVHFTHDIKIKSRQSLKVNLTHLLCIETSLSFIILQPDA